MQVVTLPDPVPVKLTFDLERKPSLDRYLAFCRANPDLRVERTAEGEIVIMPPAGGESSYQSYEVIGQLRNWARRDRRGKGFDSSVQFVLPDGSALSPDAAWVSNEALGHLTLEQRREFLRLCPEFVVEVMSPSDRLKKARGKMELWIANGAQLGWLIDGDNQTVYVYRERHPVKIYRGCKQLAGEGPVEGFVLKLGAIWKGLD